MNDYSTAITALVIVTVVIVTVCALFQLLLVNVKLLADTVATADADDDTPVDTSAVGCEFSRTVPDAKSKCPSASATRTCSLYSPGHVGEKSVSLPAPSWKVAVQSAMSAADATGVAWTTDQV